MTPGFVLGTGYTCPTCGAGSRFLVPAWRHEARYQASGQPDYLGCTECNTLMSYEAAIPDTDDAATADADTGSSALPHADRHDTEDADTDGADADADAAAGESD